MSFLLFSRQWLTIASADAVILSASNFGVTAAEADHGRTGQSSCHGMATLHFHHSAWLEQRALIDDAIRDSSRVPTCSLSI